MKKLLVIGDRSDIAQAAIAILKSRYKVVGVNRSTLDLAHPGAETIIRDLLQQHQPDVVLNCAGIFQDNNLKSDFDATFDINVKTQWSVIRYYIDNPPEKRVKFVMIGSSTYRQGRRNFILYAASRAAQYSMWQGASEYVSPMFTIGLINPVRVNTKHVAHIVHPNPAICLEAIDVAYEIEKMCDSMETHQCIDMDYKKEI
jgi:NAD(P)-dependent dehydrogenase (short-subunit alcohol dehydrogenase family)